MVNNFPVNHIESIAVSIQILVLACFKVYVFPPYHNTYQ